MSAVIITGDSRVVMQSRGPYDLIIADPPYGDTALMWDRKLQGWLEGAHMCLRDSGSLWLFASMRHLLWIGQQMEAAGFVYCQDIVWEKQNGSGLAVDRMKRVHEHVVQFRRRSAIWSGVYNEVPKVRDAVARSFARHAQPGHTGKVGKSHYKSEDGGERIMRSVVPMRNCHGFAIHETEKPVGLMDLLVRMSCPVGGLVGDWFAGSGSAGMAALQCGRDYVGCEIDPDMAQAARDRLASCLPLGF